MLKSDLANKPCAIDGCDKKRVVNSSGRVQSYCAEHLREKHRQWSKKATGKAVTPRVPKLTEAQKHAGFDREAGKQKLQPIHLCIIDEALDLMIFVDGAITLQCATDRDKLKAGGFDALLERHIGQGYWIFQSAQAVTHVE